MSQLDAFLPHGVQLLLAYVRDLTVVVLEWILNAKRKTTREKRIDETARLAQRGKRANQWPREK